MKNRPEKFSTVESAIEWAIKNGSIRNSESAAISIPPQLTEINFDGRTEFRWRTSLLDSSNHWEGWFTGLSELYLAQPCPKLLLLVSADRLDKPLLIAQMQGKIQIQLIKESTHQIMEDKPEETAKILSDFIQRHQLIKRIEQIEIINRKNNNSN